MAFTQHASIELLSRGSALLGGGFQGGEVEFDHLHHGLHGVGVADEFADVARHDLPA